VRGQARVGREGGESEDGSVDEEGGGASERVSERRSLGLAPGGVRSRAKFSAR